MFSKTLYYFVSIALFLGALMLVSAMILFRETGKSILGEKINSKHPAYKQAKRSTTNFKIGLVAALAVIFGINAVAFAIFLASKGTTETRVLLWGAPLVGILSAIFIFIDGRRRLPKIFSKK